MNDYEVWQMSCGCYGSAVVRQNLIGVVQATTSANAEILGRTLVSPGVKIEVQLKGTAV